MVFFLERFLQYLHFEQHSILALEQLWPASNENAQQHSEKVERATSHEGDERCAQEGNRCCLPEGGQLQFSIGDLQLF